MLPGGPCVLLREARLAPVVELQIWCRAGSADERAGRGGPRALPRAHALQGHRAARRRPGRGRRRGGRRADQRLHLVRRHGLPRDAAERPARDRHRRAHRRGAALGLRPGGDQPRDRGGARGDPARRGLALPGARQRRLRARVPAHPYRAPILGTPASVAAFDRARVRGFFERWYAPDQLTVVATGDFDRALLLARVREAFAGAAREPGPPRAQRRAAAARPAQLRARAALRAREPRARLARRRARPPGCSAARPARLRARLRREQPPGAAGEGARRARRSRRRVVLHAARSRSVLDQRRDRSGARRRRARRGRARGRDAAQRARDAREELEKARANFLATEHFARESVSGLAQKLGGFELLAGDYRAETRYLESVRSATPADLLRVAREHLAPETLTVGAVLPEAEAGALDARADRGRGRRRRRSDPARLRGARGASRRRRRRSATRSRTARGSTCCRAATCRWWRCAPAFLGGQLAEDADSAGLSSFLASMWLRGTEQRSAADFARASEGLAAEIDGFAGRSSLGLTLETTRESFAPAFDLFAEALLEPGLRRGRARARAQRDPRRDRAPRGPAGAAHLSALRRSALPRHPVSPAVAREHARASRPSTPRACARTTSGSCARRNLVIAVAGDVDPGRRRGARLLAARGARRGGLRAAARRPRRRRRARSGAPCCASSGRSRTS